MTASVIQPMADDWRADAPRSLRAHLGFGLLVLAYVLIAMANRCDSRWYRAGIRVAIHFIHFRHGRRHRREFLRSASLLDRFCFVPYAARRCNRQGIVKLFSTATPSVGCRSWSFCPYSCRSSYPSSA
jgi:hypothetical protein